MNITKKALRIMLTLMIAALVLCSCDSKSKMIDCGFGFFMDEETGIKVFSYEGYSLKSYPHTDSNITLPAEFFGEPIDCTFEQVFMSDQALESVIIPDSYTFLDYCTFGFCNNLKSIYIPATVTEMWEAAICSCPNVTVFCEAAEKPEGWHDRWYAECENINVVWGCKKEYFPNH